MENQVEDVELYKEVVDRVRSSGTDVMIKFNNWYGWRS